METLSPEQLATPLGVAIVTSLILRFLIKKPLRLSMGLPAESSDADDPAKKSRYSVRLNVIAFIVGEITSFVGVSIFVGASPENLVGAFLSGLIGAAAAVGVSEYASNFQKAI
jgi:hypothetical protein